MTELDLGQLVLLPPLNGPRHVNEMYDDDDDTEHDDDDEEEEDHDEDDDEDNEDNDDTNTVQSPVPSLSEDYSDDNLPFPTEMYRPNPRPSVIECQHASCDSESEYIESSPNYEEEDPDAANDQVGRSSESDDDDEDDDDF